MSWDLHWTPLLLRSAYVLGSSLDTITTKISLCSGIFTGHLLLALDQVDISHHDDVIVLGTILLSVAKSDRCRNTFVTPSTCPSYMHYPDIVNNINIV